jgi:hypothetical protein
VIAPETPLLDRLLNRAPLRRVREVVFAAACRLHLVRLDRTRADRSQLRALSGLVHRARGTRFGRDHDLARVRTAEDFRRLVPLRSPAALARAETPADAAALAACHRRALRTAFALLHAAAPRTPLLAGRVSCGRADHLPTLARPSLTADAPLTCAVEPARLCLGPAQVALLSRPEAPIAVEDPRLGGMRLLIDHGVYFEFVPAARPGERLPTRLSIHEVRPGEVYELAITSPGGWWACLSGLFVAFERLSPPVLRVVPAPSRPDALTAPASHRRTAGTPAAPPETSAHTPWSVPADRG